jgi:hypothetical protein
MVLADIAQRAFGLDHVAKSAVFDDQNAPHPFRAIRLAVAGAIMS